MDLFGFILIFFFCTRTNIVTSHAIHSFLFLLLLNPFFLLILLFFFCSAGLLFLFRPAKYIYHYCNSCGGFPRGFFSSFCFSNCCLYYRSPFAFFHFLQDAPFTFAMLFIPISYLPRYLRTLILPSIPLLPVLYEFCCLLSRRCFFWFVFRARGSGKGEMVDDSGGICS